MRINIRNERGQTKMIGTIDEYGIFRKTVQKSKHLFRKLDAWGIDGRYFHGVLSSEQCKFILVHETEENVYYMTTPKVLREKGEWKHFIPHGAQIFLSRRYWMQSGDPVSPDRIKELLATPTGE